MMGYIYKITDKTNNATVDIKKYKKEWYETNRERLLEKQSIYQDENKEKYKEYQKQYREQNKEKAKEYNKQYKIRKSTFSQGTGVAKG